jgi:hypothetical protein
MKMIEILSIEFKNSNEWIETERIQYLIFGFDEVRGWILRPQMKTIC